ncbi:class I SAM-dependent methyltransferase [Hoeflea alexandrii]|uniref:class I SAM-dependent methyltransferase n=1 Tax=Hoeflea alexandrii TaxID=288436 RepID=UPI0022AE7823|nr:class I SAM-dependent methyltransferase [Hoeflea alexandrii]
MHHHRIRSKAIMSRMISRCRICGNEHLAPILDLGEQVMSGIFPRSEAEQVDTGPLQLVKCTGKPEEVCGLVQLAHTFDLEAMYGERYGYRSGLNASMVKHLHAKVGYIQETAPLRAGDLIVDIGSNDGTTLSAYPADLYDLVGVDPTGRKFASYYKPHIRLIPDFFSAETLRRHLGERRARVITSFSMFYDLEAPAEFMHEVIQMLEDDGIWVLEQSYLPTMLARNSYDTVCHEHLEYYALAQIKWMTDRAGAKIIDVSFNDVNGGSFSLTVARKEAPQPEFYGLSAILEHETALGLDGLAPFRAFADRVEKSRDALREFFQMARQKGAYVGALGASTKGNVLLQYCGVTTDDIAAVGEVNEDKFGAFTPGTLIPIIPESELLKRNPDYLIVLPWHFKQFFDNAPHLAGLKLVYPLPEIQIHQTN